MIRYESAGRVKVSAVGRILEEIGAMDRRWWHGRLGLDAEEEGRPSILRGRTPLFYPQGVPEEDDLFMAFGDALFIVHRLADWAGRFKIKWRVTMNDEDWGAIDPGGPTRPLVEQMDKWDGRVGAARVGGKDWGVSEYRREEILNRTGGRR
jgi:hypothetical protein